MRRNPRPLATLVLVALIGAGCGSNAPSTSGTAGTTSGSSGSSNTVRGKAIRFAQCMRDNGVKEFPDPDASGELTIDGIVNGSSLDPNAPAWKEAIGACRDLQPPGFTGHRRSAGQQEVALTFAQCMRDNGVKDFPDPAAGEPLIDTTKIPSLGDRSPRTDPVFVSAMDECGDVLAAALREHQ